MKADSGGDGEPSVRDDQSSSCPTQTHPEGSSCGQTDLRTDQSGDHEPTTSQIFAAIDSACGEPALERDGPDEGLCDEDKISEDQTALVQDASTLCADISSGVSHMDIDVGAEAGDATVAPGIVIIF